MLFLHSFSGAICSTSNGEERLIERNLFLPLLRLSIIDYWWWMSDESICVWNFQRLTVPNRGSSANVCKTTLK